MADAILDDVNYTCERCGFPAVLVNGRWTHASTADAAMCQILEWADRGRRAQRAINELGTGPDHG